MFMCYKSMHALGVALPQRFPPDCCSLVLSKTAYCNTFYYIRRAMHTHHLSCHPLLKPVYRSHSLATSVSSLPHSRYASSSIFKSARSTASQVVKPSDETHLPPQLPNLVDTATLQREIGYYPKAPLREELDTSKGWGLSKLIIYLLAHILPIGGGIYAFKVITEMHQQSESYLSGVTIDEILADVLKVIRGGAACFFMNQDDLGYPCAARVEPHFPEDRVLRLPTEPVIQGIKNNVLTDLFAGEYSEFHVPLNFIHFALKSHSPQADSLASNRRISLLYHDQDRGISIQLNGLASVISSEENKRHYWRSRWAIMCNDEADYTLIKFVPSTILLQKANWESKLLQRTVTEKDIYWELVKTQ